MTTRSKGHIAFDAHGREWYEQSGEVYVGPRDRPIGTHGYRLGARWEGSRAWFDRNLPAMRDVWGLADA